VKNPLSLQGVPWGFPLSGSKRGTWRRASVAFYNHAIIGLPRLEQPAAFPARFAQRPRSAGAPGSPLPQRFPAKRRDFPDRLPGTGRPARSPAGLEKPVSVPSAFPGIFPRVFIEACLDQGRGLRFSQSDGDGGPVGKQIPGSRDCPTANPHRAVSSPAGEDSRPAVWPSNPCWEIFRARVPGSVLADGAAANQLENRTFLVRVLPARRVPAPWGPQSPLKPKGKSQHERYAFEKTPPGRARPPPLLGRPLASVACKRFPIRPPL